jgi:hypothetical protein
MVAYLEHLAETHVHPEGKNAGVYFEPRVAGRDAPQLSGWGPHCPRWSPGDSVKPVWGLPARLKPKIPRYPPGVSVETVWSLPAWFGPITPRWPPGASVEHVWGLPARFGPVMPQMASGSLCGDRLGSPGPVRAHRGPDGFQEALWSTCGVSPDWL